MSDYNRLYIPGGTCFFTLATYHRQPILADIEKVELLRRCLREVKAKRPFDIVAAVVLPEHLHCLWRLPTCDADYSTRWQMVKTAFSRHVPAKIRKDGSKTVWQPRFYEHCIRDETDFHRHLDYIHYNPVKHGWVSMPSEWPHSSFAHFVAMGWYASGWGEAPPADLDGVELE